MARWKHQNRKTQPVAVAVDVYVAFCDCEALKTPFADVRVAPAVVVRN